MRAKFLGSVRKFFPTISRTRYAACAIAVLYFFFGLTMCLQGGRYENTPSYANLLAFVEGHSWIWGICYLVASGMLFGVVFRKHLKLYSVLAHGYSGGLTLWWLLAFVIRYATDDGTTIVNVGSWSLYAFCITVSAVVVGEEIVEGELE